MTVKKNAVRNKRKIISWCITAAFLGVGLLLLPPIRSRIFPFALFVSPQRFFYTASHDKTVPHQAPNLNAFPDSLDDLAIVAHYDDEALAIGGFLAGEVRANKKVGVVVVSYSEGNPTAVRNWFGRAHSFYSYHWKLINHLRLLPADFSNYAEERERETDAVLDRIGIPRTSRIYMRYPEKGVDTFRQQPEQAVAADYLDPISGKRETYTGEALRQTIQDIVTRSKPTRIITHLPDDTNTFHRLVGVMATDINAKQQTPSALWDFLTHWNVHDGSSVPQEYSGEQSWLQQEPTDLFIPPQGSPQESVTGCNATHIPWPEDFVSWKRRLVSLYNSQVQFDPLMPQLFSKRNELFWELASKTLHEYVYDDASLAAGANTTPAQGGICTSGTLRI